MKYCEDCGCKVFNGACVNCHEEIYIAEQYYEENMLISSEFRDIVIEKQKDVECKRSL